MVRFWFPSHHSSHRRSHASARLLEHAGAYFDIESFPEGETKRALKRVLAKKRGLPMYETDRGSSSGGENRKKKKIKA